MRDQILRAICVAGGDADPESSITAASRKTELGILIAVVLGLSKVVLAALQVIY